MAKFYVLGMMQTIADGTEVPTVISPVFTGKDMKKYIQLNSPLSIDAKLFELNEFSFTITKKTVSIEIDDMAIGSAIP